VASSIELLSGRDDVSPTALEMVAAHHERYDGSGYPDRIAGSQLRLPCEMAGLVDSYCAMTRQRAYSDAVSSQRALEALIRLRGSKFRDTLVDQFVQCVGIYPIGSLVELNTGEVAVVIQQYQVKRLRPKVLVLLAEDKSVQRRPRTLDLLLDPLTPTGEVYRIRQALAPDAYGIHPSDFYLD
jgi:HD-GYP domain-containing protein (c-di-GMP phosphodiesterase class II)